MVGRFFKKILRWIFNQLREDKRIRLIRHFISVPDLAFSDKFVVRLAETKEELESAYHLLYESYLKIGIISEHTSKLRCTPFSLLPETATVIVVFENRVVGTVSLIMDSVFGLPSDHSYGDQNNKLRSGNHKLCEVSALAVDKEFRAHGHAVSLLLMKYLYNYCRMVQVSHLVCTIHPRAYDFYKAFWDFKNDGPVIDYDYVDAPATHLFTELTDEHQNRVISFFEKKTPKYNPGYFCINYDHRFIYPDLSKGKIFRPIMNPTLLEYFFLRKTDLFDSLTQSQQSVFFSIYLHYFEAHQLSAFLKANRRKKDRRLQYRVPVQIPCSLKLVGEIFYKMAVIRDLSEEGVFVHLIVDENPDVQFESIQFTISKQKFNLKIEKKWVNSNAVFRLGTGIGFIFLTQDVRLHQILIQTPHSQDRRNKVEALKVR